MRCSMSVSQASDCTPLSLRGTAGGIAGVVTAWVLASIPIYYWRHQIMLEKERIRTLAGSHTVAARGHCGSPSSFT